MSACKRGGCKGCLRAGQRCRTHDFVQVRRFNKSGTEDVQQAQALQRIQRENYEFLPQHHRPWVSWSQCCEVRTQVLQLANCCPFLLSWSPSRLVCSQSNARAIAFSDNDTAVKLSSFALMPVAVALPVGTRCRFKVQLIQAPPSLGGISFGVATSSVGLERISTIGNQRNT